MNTTHAFDMARRMGEDLLDYGPDRSRLLIQVMRMLVQGHPVTGEQVDQLVEAQPLPWATRSSAVTQVAQDTATDPRPITMLHILSILQSPALHPRQ